MKFKKEKIHLIFLTLKKNCQTQAIFDGSRLVQVLKELMMHSKLILERWDICLSLDVYFKYKFKNIFPSNENLGWENMGPKRPSYIKICNSALYDCKFMRQIINIVEYNLHVKFAVAVAFELLVTDNCKYNWALWFTRAAYSGEVNFHSISITKCLCWMANQNT